MATAAEIKRAPDVVIVQHYKNGTLVAVDYKSSLGTITEQYAKEKIAELEDMQAINQLAESKNKKREDHNV